MSTSPSIAFFGATGGCTAVVLAKTLQSGQKATALARTPTKLTDLLTKTHNVPSTVVESNLTIIPGSVTDVAAVKQVLNPLSGPVSLIIFGIGGTPKMQFSITAPVTIDNPSVCEDGTKTIISALGEIMAASGGAYKKPVMSVISTTGVSKKQDVPYVMYPLYHALLHVPHKDKKIMEDLVTGASKGDQAVLGGFVVVRPTLLTDGEAKGLEKVRVGWTRPDDMEVPGEEVPGPEMGYGVSRADVGLWIYEKVVKGDGEYVGKCVSLTY